MAKKPPRPESGAPPPADEGLSLDKLTSAFAEMMGRDDPYNPATEKSPAADDPSAALVAELADVAAAAEAGDAACEISPQTILEAMLFVGDPENAPIQAEWIAGLMRGVRPGELDAAVVELNSRYRRQNRPYEIVSEGKGYRLALRPEFRSLRDKCYGRDRAVRLSQAAVDVLSLVAYHGSLTADEINKLRGKASGAILNQLLRRKLLRLDRPDGTPRRQAKFVPTKRFLDLFGLAGLEDLPRAGDVAQK